MPDWPNGNLEEFSQSWKNSRRGTWKNYFIQYWAFSENAAALWICGNYIPAINTCKNEVVRQWNSKSGFFEVEKFLNAKVLAFVDPGTQPFFKSSNLWLKTWKISSLLLKFLMSPVNGHPFPHILKKPQKTKFKPLKMFTAASFKAKYLQATTQRLIETI